MKLIILLLLFGGSAVTAHSCCTYSFIYDCDTIRQTAVIEILNDTKIAFKLISYNKRRNKTTSISGTAENKYKNFGASETEEDELGNLYPVVEYIYDEKCWLSFRFDTQYTKLTIKEADNDNHNPYCPLESVEAFKRCQTNF